MQFIIMAYDGNDEKTFERRATFREEYLKIVEKMSEEKKHLWVETYATGKVWENIEIKSCKVGPMFVAL